MGCRATREFAGIFADGACGSSLRASRQGAAEGRVPGVASPAVTEAIRVAPSEGTSTHLLVVCALLTAAARFVPVPLLDDVVKTRIRQYLVSRLLRRSGRSFGSGRVGALWQDSEGCGSGCLALAWKVPLKIVLFPIRKIVAIVTAIQGFSRDVTRSLLFGRAVERALAQGLLAEGGEPVILAAEATAVRRAFDHAVAGTDTALVGGVLADALRGVRGLPGAALRAARSLARADLPAEPEASASASASASDRQLVEQGAGAVEAALQRPDVIRAIADFDSRFDAALAAARGSS